VKRQQAIKVGIIAVFIRQKLTWNLLNLNPS
jgi:hypothetical protein